MGTTGEMGGEERRGEERGVGLLTLVLCFSMRKWFIGCGCSNMRAHTITKPFIVH